MAKNQPLSPSKIGKFQELLGAVLRKSVMFDDEAQDVIENHWPELREVIEPALLKTINEFLEQRRNTIIRIVPRMDCTRTPQAVLDATGRHYYPNPSVINTMPAIDSGILENVEVVFFRLGRDVDDVELVREYEKRGLVSHPYAQAWVNEADPAFADEHPNCTHWENGEGGWYFLSFFRQASERCVRADLVVMHWGRGFWFAGVRKSDLVAKK